MYNRLISFENLEEDSVFLFGARQTGKSTVLQMRYPDAIYYDLLERNTFERLQRNPALLEQELSVLSNDTLVIIDELPLMPILLDQVHRLIVRKNMRFILTGSSARKLKRQGVNTLGGRAMVRTLYPLVSAEIPDFELDRAINQGLLPRHYMAKPAIARERLKAYISVYLKEEINGKEGLIE